MRRVAPAAGADFYKPPRRPPPRCGRAGDPQRFPPSAAGPARPVRYQTLLTNSAIRGNDAYEKGAGARAVAGFIGWAEVLDSDGAVLDAVRAELWSDEQAGAGWSGDLSPIGR